MEPIDPEHCIEVRLFIRNIMFGYKAGPICEYGTNKHVIQIFKKKRLSNVFNQNYFYVLPSIQTTCSRIC